MFRYLTYISLIFILVLACTEKKTPTKKVIKTVNYFPKFNIISRLEKKLIQKESMLFFNEYLKPIPFNGQFLVAKNGEVLYLKAQGWSNKRKKELMTKDTPMHVASVSKVVTAVAVLKLVQEGKLKLEDDIRNFLPEILYNGITIRDLLSHRSGIPYYGYFTFKTWNLGTTLKNKNILKLINKHRFPLNFQPNTHFSYCNTNFALLALIVERITDQKFPHAMKTIIFDPLKMDNSFILSSKKEWKNSSQSYKSTFELQGFDYLDAVYGDKNLYTTALDLLKLDKALYGNAFLHDSIKKQMFKGYSYERPGKSNYGLGIRLKEEKGKETYFFHTGWWHGNTACYSRLQKDTICIIALSNVYTRSVYGVSRLASKFGNYPFSFDEEK